MVFFENYGVVTGQLNLEFNLENVSNGILFVRIIFDDETAEYIICKLN
jgi:hypothetical protein